MVYRHRRGRVNDIYLISERAEFVNSIREDFSTRRTAVFLNFNTVTDFYGLLHSLRHVGVIE